MFLTFFCEGRWLHPLTRWHVWHLAESDLLHLLSQLLSLALIARAHPLGNESFELRDVRPTEIGALPAARDTEVDGRIDDVSRLPPSVK
jgi:hypothetical protein